MSAIELFNSLKQFSNPINDNDFGAVYSSLLEIPNAPYTTFIKLGYFRNCKDAIQRFQEIPDEYKTFYNPTKLFISHKWETAFHPDKSRKTLERLLSLTQNCDDDAAIWLDFCSLPQVNSENGMDDRSEELKDFFKFQLTIIPLVILDSQSMFLWSDEGLNSGWCCIELLIAQALLQHLNKMIYARKNSFSKPPLFVTQVENMTVVQSDLARFDHRIFQKLYITEVANDKHIELIGWINQEINNGARTPYSQLVKQVTPEIISKLISEHDLRFTNSLDEPLVLKLLCTIYRRLSFEPFNSFKWKGKQDFFSMWHYVKGCLGNCVVPNFSYWF